MSIKSYMQSAMAFLSPNKGLGALDDHLLDDLGLDRFDIAKYRNMSGKNGAAFLNARRAERSRISAR